MIAVSTTFSYSTGIATGYNRTGCRCGPSTPAADANVEMRWTGTERSGVQRDGTGRERSGGDATRREERSKRNEGASSSAAQRRAEERRGEQWHVASPRRQEIIRHLEHHSSILSTRCFPPLHRAATAGSSPLVRSRRAATAATSAAAADSRALHCTRTLQ